MTTSITIHRHFDATPERVFDLWLDVEALRQFMMPSDEILRCTVDPRVGGAFTIVVRRAGAEIEHVGTYQALDRPRRLAFLWTGTGFGPATLVTIELAAAGGGTDLTLTHSRLPDDAEIQRRNQHGWTMILDRLAAARR
jgi:uncharacterized protein YndB with AHSA1/START domain